MVRLRPVWMTNHPPSVLWHCWLGQNRRPYNRYCVCADVEPCSISQSMPEVRSAIRNGDGYVYLIRSEVSMWHCHLCVWRLKTQILLTESNNKARAIKLLKNGNIPLPYPTVVTLTHDPTRSMWPMTRFHPWFDPDLTMYLWCEWQSFLDWDSSAREKLWSVNVTVQRCVREICNKKHSAICGTGRDISAPQLWNHTPSPTNQNCTKPQGIM